MAPGSSGLLRQPVTQRLILLGTLPSQEIVRIAEDPELPGRRFAERAYLSGQVTDEQIVAACLSLGARDCTRIMERNLPPELTACIPADVATEWRVLPFQHTGGRLHVAMLDPFDQEARDACARLSGCAVEAWVARASVFFDVLCRAYGGTPPVPSLPHRAGPVPVRAHLAVPSQTPAFAMPAAAPRPVPVLAARPRATVPGIPVAPPLKLRIPVAAAPPVPLAPPPREAGTPVPFAQSPTPRDMPMALPLKDLVPPFRMAVLLQAVDGMAEVLQVAGVPVERPEWRTLRVSLRSPSALRQALLSQAPVFGPDPADAGVFLWAAVDPDAAAPDTWSVWPLGGGDRPLRLLYVDGADPRQSPEARDRLEAAFLAWSL